MIKKLLFTISLISFISFLPAQNLSCEWGMNIGGINDDFAKQVITDTKGNSYTVGYFSGTVDFDKSTNVYNLSTGSSSYIACFLLKQDSMGNFLWVTKFQGTTASTGGIDFAKLKIDSSDNLYIFCSLWGTSKIQTASTTFSLTYAYNSQDRQIIKLDQNSGLLWIKDIIKPSLVTNASSYLEYLDLTIDSFDNLLIVGQFPHTVNFNPSSSYSLTASSNINGDIFILKLDNSANFIWCKQIKAEIIPTNNFTANSLRPGNGKRKIATDASGNVFLTGDFRGVIDFDPSPSTSYTMTPNGGTSNAFIVKLSPSGSFLWAKQLIQTTYSPAGSTSSSYSEGVSIAVSPSGDVYSSGIFRHTIDFDPNVGVSTVTASGAFNTDYYILKLGTNGDYKWVRSFGASYGFEIFELITESTSNSIYAAGRFSGTADFDPSAASYNLASPVLYSFDIFTFKLNASGIFQWAVPFGHYTNEDELYASTCVDNYGSIYSTGTFHYISGFDPNFSSFTATATINPSSSSKFDDLYLFKLKQHNVSTGIPTIINQDLATNLYPNPTNDSFTMQLNSGATIVITNALGEIILKEKKVEGNHTFNIQNEASGIYFVNITSNKQQQTFKLVKQ